MTAPQNGQANLAKTPNPKKLKSTVVDLLEANKAELAKVMPKHITVDRLVKLMIYCFDANPDLYKCSTVSLFAAIKQLAELGIEPGGVRGLAYLIPFKVGGADLGRTCQLIIGYKGFIHLAKRSGMVSDVEARVVHKNDVFDISFGLQPKLKHKPAFENPGPPIGVYCIARGQLVHNAAGELVRTTGDHVEFMRWDEVQAIKARALAKGRGDSPWKTDEEEMARKTVVRRWAKYGELSPEMADALRADQDDGEVIQGEVITNVTAAVEAKKAASLASDTVIEPALEPAPAEETKAEGEKETPKTDEAPKRVERKEVEAKPEPKEEPKPVREERKGQADAAPTTEREPGADDGDETPAPSEPPKMGTPEHAQWLIEQINAAPSEKVKKDLAKQVSFVHPEWTQRVQKAYLAKKF